jgi:L-alanine-DL-glutamate epimerase-like enolase superfamily enzyme
MIEQGTKEKALKITNVERILVDIPFGPVAERNMNRELVGWHISEVCRVTTDAAIVGYGETLPNYTWGLVSQEGIDRVMGRSPFEVMWDDSLGCGLQMALFDAAGKAAGVPCYRLMGHQVREWCPISWWSIDMPAEDFVAEARQAVELGYVSYKQKARPWFDIHRQVAETAKVIPNYFKLDLDFNGQLLNAGNAVTILKDLDTFPNVAIYESPIPQDDVDGNKKIRAQVRCPIAMHYGSPPIMTALREEVCDGFVVGGGATGVLRQAQVAQEANKPFWLQLVGTGITTAFALHLGAVCTHAQWPAVTCLNLYQHQLLAEPIAVQGGYAHVPEAPGLGIVVPEDVLQRFRTDSSIRQRTRAVYAVVRPNGERTYYASETQYWDDFLGGNQIGFEPGIRLDALADDGSADWQTLEAKVRKGPVRSRNG